MVVSKDFFNFHHYFGEDDFLFDSYFSKGLVQPPSRKLWWKTMAQPCFSKQKLGGIYGYLPFQVCQPLLGNVPWRMGSQDLDLWLITMVSCKSSKDRVVGPLPNGRTSWLINGSYQPLTIPGMILQVRFFCCFYALCREWWILLEYVGKIPFNWP